MAEADSLVRELSLQDLLQALLSGVSDKKSSNLKEALDGLIVASRNSEGRSYLASKNILPSVLQLTQSLLYQSACNEYLILLLKLLRNLCAGEIANQNSFIEQNGVGVVVDALKLLGNATDVDIVGIRFGLQVLANVSLAGKEHQHAIWHQLFPCDFYWLAKLRSLETCDPLYMVIYVCSDGIPELVQQLSRDEGLPIVTEIVITASIVGFKEDWLKLLLSQICLENDIFPHLFSSLFNEDARSNGKGFSQEQAYLLNVLSTILNERLEELSVPHNFALHVFEIVKRSIEFIDFSSRGKTGLPIGSAEVDVLGYSLSMVRDICAQDGQLKFTGDSGAVDHLLSTGLLEVFLRLLSELELPSTIKKALRQTENQQATPSDHVKVCPYKEFRRDIVAIIGNCAYRRKHVQDMIRDRKWILLLLQQCVADEDNPYLREWGIWCVRNLLEGNAENQEAVAELEIQGSVQTPELAGLGLRVEVDENTKRAKLVNIS